MAWLPWYRWRFRGCHQTYPKRKSAATVVAESGVVLGQDPATVTCSPDHPALLGADPPGQSIDTGEPVRVLGASPVLPTQPMPCCARTAAMPL